MGGAEVALYAQDANPPQAHGLLTDWGFWGFVLAAVVAVASAATWFQSQLAKGRRVAASATPVIQFTIASYTLGGVFGIHARIHNEGPGSAHSLTLRLSCQDEVLWRLDRLTLTERVDPRIPISDTSPLRVQRLPELRAILEYNDRLALPHRLVLPLQQVGNDGELFTARGTGAASDESPTVRWRTLWGFREQQ